MTDDIVARLRGIEGGYNLRNLFHQAADEIERLRSELFPIRKELDQMRTERDGARAEVCLLRTARTEATDVVDQAMADYAVSRGWDDLFKEVTDER